MTLGAFKGDFGYDVGSQNSYAQYLVENWPNGGIVTKADVPDAVTAYTSVL